MTTNIMKVEVEDEACCVCGDRGELVTPEEHDAGIADGQPPLRSMLLHLNNNKILPDGRLCLACVRRTVDSYEFSTALASKTVPPLSDKIRALRRRLHELTQKIDVFIVVGGGGVNSGTAYSEEDIIMVERESLAAAAAADDADLERARNARGDTVYQCSICPLSFERVSEYRSHMGSHGGGAEALHSCWTCGAQFRTAAALREHSASHAPMALFCHLCNIKFANEWELRSHERRCVGACPACGEAFASRAELREHAALRHGRGAAPPLVCPACLAPLSSAAQLSAHLLRHRQAKQFVCGYHGCILRFANRSHLMAHIRKCHGGADADPDASPALQDHLEASAQASAAAPTTCDVCQRTFGSVAAMKRHRRVHRDTQQPQQPQQAPLQPAIQEDGTDLIAMELEQMGEGDGDGEVLDGEVEYLEMEALEDDYDVKPMVYA